MGQGFPTLLGAIDLAQVELWFVFIFIFVGIGI
jgi:hypothetical protein